MKGHNGISGVPISSILLSSARLDVDVRVYAKLWQDRQYLGGPFRIEWE